MNFPEFSHGKKMPKCYIFFFHGKLQVVEWKIIKVIENIYYKC